MDGFKSNFLKDREHRFGDDVEMLLLSKDKIQKKMGVLVRVTDFLNNPPSGIRPGFLKDREKRKGRIEGEIADLGDDIINLEASIPKAQQVRQATSDAIPEKEVEAAAKRAVEKSAQKEKRTKKKKCPSGISI